LEESLNSSYDNVYIYHTDNLKNLEIDPELWHYPHSIYYL
jgi:hypothetical protein